MNVRTDGHTVRMTLELGVSFPEKHPAQSGKTERGDLDEAFVAACPLRWLRGRRSFSALVGELGDAGALLVNPYIRIPFFRTSGLRHA